MLPYRGKIPHGDTEKYFFPPSRALCRLRFFDQVRGRANLNQFSRHPPLKRASIGAQCESGVPKGGEGGRAAVKSWRFVQGSVFKGRWSGRIPFNEEAFFGLV